MNVEYIAEGFREWLPALTEKALEAYRRAISWRNFLVGCAVLASKKGEGYKIFAGANCKTEKNGYPICAEQVAIMATVAEGYDRIHYIVVVGKAQKDESGVLRETLHPCAKCRQILSDIITKKVDSDILDFNTILVMKDPESEK